MIRTASRKEGSQKKKFTVSGSTSATPPNCLSQVIHISLAAAKVSQGHAKRLIRPRLIKCIALKGLDCPILYVKDKSETMIEILSRPKNVRQLERGAAI